MTNIPLSTDQARSEQNELAAYLAGNPGKTARDFKGKDTAPFDKLYVAPGECPFDQLDAETVRREAVGVPAIYLPRNIRQAAGRDRALIFDDQARAYRLLAPSDGEERCASTGQYLDQTDAATSPPAPAPAGLGGADREGVSETFDAATPPTSGDPEFIKSDRFSIGEQ